MSTSNISRRKGKAKRNLVTKPMTYEVTNNLPDEPKPTVRLLFEGLLWFVFHSRDECEVGIHNTTHDGAHDHQHDLIVKVWNIESGCGTGDKKCKKKYPPFHIGNPKDITGIQIDVNRNSLKEKGVYVFQQDVDDGSGGRTFHENDWRWVIEFEKAPLYQNGIKLDDTKVNPIVSINHGVFYTLYKTTNLFELVSDDQTVHHPARKVALMVGANLYVEEGGDVTLTIRRKFPLEPLSIPLPWIKDQCYQIDIRNICVKGKNRCTPDDYGEKKNDFYLYNETFTKPFGQPDYVLQMSGSPQTADRPPKGICFDDDDEPSIRSSNDAPCGPVSAGGGGGG